MAATSVWVKTPDGEAQEVPFLPATVLSSDDQTVEVKLEQSGEGLKKGEVRRMPVSDTRPRFHRGDSSTASDNTALVHMNDAAILDNLQNRHKQNEIYTYTASVLLAVNPYKKIAGLYGQAQCAQYRGKHIGALPPHPYAIADTAYRLLVREKTDQALLISGESGAGKTETAKIVMEYLAYVSGSASDLSSKIQERVMQAQPILESFGNAVTLRNSNSSRFGKYNQIYFDTDGVLVDAGIQTYLLESSRVVVHGESERTYHVFYEMLQGLSAEKLQAFHLDKSRQYRLLHNNGASAGGFEEHDKGNFGKLSRALETLYQDTDSIDSCFKTLAGLVHLGDIPKEDAEVEMAARAQQDDNESDTRTVEVNDESVAHAAELLGFDPDELCGVLKRRQIKIPGRDSMHEAPRSPLQLRQVLHSFIKAIYKRLFEYTVRRINDSFRELRPQQANSEELWKNIGILDIYGFERLKKNSFEQLCINLANERLQQYFVENVLGAEQLLYSREGLPWTGLQLPDSEPVVSCIAHVFRTLDDFSSRQAKGFGEGAQVSDDRFCEKVLKECAADSQRKDILKAPKLSAKHARLSANHKLNEFFVITHYAGQVDYCTKGWLDKNNDRLLAECEELINDSSVPFVKALGEEDNKQTFRSISNKYQKDLESLLTTLGEASLHYIRCFKPNTLQKAEVWNGKLVLDQIIQCGTIELVKIMHDGFPNRCNFEELYNRFKKLLPEKFQRYGVRTFIEALMLAYEVPREQWALGTSRLFLKAGQLQALENMREEGAVPKTENLERIVKQIIRKRWSRAIVAVRLCVWIPKFLRQLNFERASTALAATTLVTSRLAPHLEAARKRVLERRQKARRRLAGVFHTVVCMRGAFAKIREKRRQRAVNALHLGSFIVARVKPWAERARAYLADAEVRRQREEEQRRQEMEKRLKEEEERLRLEAETRRQEEEERRRIEEEVRCQEEEERRRVEEENRQQEEEAAEKKRQEEELERARLEEARVARQEAEKLEREQKAEEERLEQERLLEEQRRRCQEELEAMRQANKKAAEEELEAEKQRMAAAMAEQLAEQKRILEEQNAEMQRQAAADLEAQEQKLLLERQKLEEERQQAQQQQEKLEQERQEVAVMHESARQARLSISQMSGSVASGNLSVDEATEIANMRFANEDADTDIGDSVSVAGRIPPVDPMVQAMVREATRAEVARLSEQREVEDAGVREQLRIAQERNASLERKLRKDTKEVGSHSPLAHSPLANGTPSKELHSAPSPLALSPINSTPGSGAHSRRVTQNTKRSSLMSSPAHEERRYSLLPGSGQRSKRLSVAHEAFNLNPMKPTEDKAESSPAVNGSFESSTLDASTNRKWWAEQRKFLMTDLYTWSGTKGSPTPTRNRRLTQVPGQEAPQPVAADSARDLAAEFDAPDVPQAADQGADAVEWVADLRNSKTKMRSPKVHRKGGK